MADLCVICQAPLISGQTVNLSQKGLTKLIDCSKRYKDGLWQNIANINQIQLHVSCRKNYTRESSIRAAESKHDANVMTKETRTRKCEDQFDFKGHCLFCGATCGTVKKAHKNVRVVATLGIKQNIEARCTARNDDWSHKVYARIATTGDLVAAEARYHVMCHRDFFRESSQRKAGRPVDESKESAFQKLRDFIENSDDCCQFSLQELEDKMKDITGEIWSRIYLKKDLLNIMETE